MTLSTGTTAELRIPFVGGEKASLEEVFLQFRPRLLRMVAARLDERLQGRVDASDVIQESFVVATKKFDEYMHMQGPKIPLLLWLRLIVRERLQKQHRHHLRVQQRAASREVSLEQRTGPDASAVALAIQCVNREASPNNNVLKAERVNRLRIAIQSMAPQDRDVLSLRHFKELRNSQVACELQISEEAAAKRYIRAMKRLKQILSELTADPKGL